MRSIKTAIAIVLTLAAAGLFGQSSSEALDSKVKVQAIRVGTRATESIGGKEAPDPSRIEIDFLNTSQVGITAVGYEYTVQYPDGGTATLTGATDFAAVLAISDVSATLPANSTFKSNAAFTARVDAARRSDGAAPVLATAKVTMIISEDRTALGAQRDIQMILRSRVVQKQNYEDIVAALQAAARTADPYAAIVQESKRLLDNNPSFGSPYASRAQMLKSIAAAVGMAPPSARANVLSLYIDQDQRRARFLDLHSTLSTEGGVSQ
jgi:hypothetical protein